MKNTHQRRRLQTLAQHLTVSQECAVPDLVEPCRSSTQRGAPVVIGGMVLDIQAAPLSHEIRPGTTSPGAVRYVRGGVARNVAECLAKLDELPFLISIVGDDIAAITASFFSRHLGRFVGNSGEFLLAHWRSLGLAVDGIRRCSGTSTPVVSAVFDGRGELAAAVADTQAVEVHLTPDWIEGFVREIQAAPVILLDANLHPLALKTACRLANDGGVPVWFEPVSVAKSVRAADLLPSITFVSPNEAEIVAMAEALHLKKNGSPVQLHVSKEGSVVKSISDILGHDLRVPIRGVLDAGVKYIILTLGSQGAVLCSKEPLGQIVFHHYPASVASVVNLSGAGDCLVAGTLAALSRKLVEVQAVAYGVGAAKLAVESDMNVPHRMPWAEVADQAKSVLGQARTFVVLT